MHTPGPWEIKGNKRCVEYSGDVAETGLLEACEAFIDASDNDALVIFGTHGWFICDGLEDAMRAAVKKARA